MTDPCSGVAPDRTIIETPAADLGEWYRKFAAQGYRLALVAAHHDGTRAGILIVYLLVAGPPDSRIELHVRVPADHATIPSLAAQSFPAGRFEREMHDLFGVEPTGHLRPARLVLHQHWPAGWHPMRADAGPTPPFGDESQPYPFLTVDGRGVYEIPVGPVHAGLIEPGHFRFSVVGETILAMRARLWFVHKGIERLFQGRRPMAAVDLAERVSGDTAVGHTLAFCLAVEEATGTAVPYPAQVLRAVLLELERLYNHTADIGALCNDVGFGIVHAHALRIRERLLRLNATVTGHRLLRGGVFPGGATVRALPTPEVLEAIRADLADVVGIALANSTVVDRFTGTAVLGSEQAGEIGVLGYVARASGLRCDARSAHPFADLYADLDVPVRHDGDVLARFSIRVAEFDASVRLLRRLLAEAEIGQHAVALRPPPHPLGHGVGLVEGWRGTIAQRVQFAPDGTLSRVKIVDPSFLNWPALPVALADTIVPDFPLANKSFNLSYAGNDL
jgi:Ni,Fe-hydrogenase III large subunit/Ni,Fe-hydrogenase III component G